MNVPKDFGKVNGTPIANKDVILDEINNVLEKYKNPSIEYLFVKPFSHIALPFGYGITYNNYGHSAVRYTHPDGRDVVMNIQGKEHGKLMVRYYDAKEYMFGTQSDKIGSQKGIYNRDIVGLRIENVNTEDIQKMHDYFEQLQIDEQHDLKKFNIIFGPIINIVRNFFDLPEYGNCAKWISEGLYRAKITTQPSIWPKSIFVNIFENYESTNVKNRNNMSVVYYKRPEHAILSYGKNAVAFEGVAPLQPIRSFMYGNLMNYANCTVKVPKNEIYAIIERNENPVEPSQFRNIVNDKYFITCSIISTALGIRYGFKNRKNIFKNIYNVNNKLNLF